MPFCHRLQWMASVTQFLSASVRSPGEFCFMRNKVSYVRTKNLACEILRLRRVATATQFLSAAVRSPGGFCFIGNEVSYKATKVCFAHSRVVINSEGSTLLPRTRMIAKQHFLSCECASSHEVCFYDIGLQSNFLCHKKRPLHPKMQRAKLSRYHLYSPPTWAAFFQYAAAFASH